MASVTTAWKLKARIIYNIMKYNCMTTFPVKILIIHLDNILQSICPIELVQEGLKNHLLCMDLQEIVIKLYAIDCC